MNAARRTGVASATALFSLALASVVAPYTAPKWTQAAGLDVWELPVLQSKLKTETERAPIVKAKFEHCQRRLEVKRALIDLLLEGRISFEEVTAEFLTLNRSEPIAMELLRTFYTDATDEEKMARHVLDVATRLQTGSSAERLVVSARLQAEFRHAFGDTTAGTP